MDRLDALLRAPEHPPKVDAYPAQKLPHRGEMYPHKIFVFCDQHRDYRAWCGDPRAMPMSGVQPVWVVDSHSVAGARPGVDRVVLLGESWKYTPRLFRALVYLLTHGFAR